MSWQPILDFLVTAFVLIAVVVLAYCGIRKCGIKEMWEEIMEIINGKAAESKEQIIYG